ncbi:MAG: AtpZ/AtpI family protein [Lachnospiraceae bacterium]|nr:AtpZ/AtpI family protein [Lachnospiraceae bacterium]
MNDNNNQVWKMIYLITQIGFTMLTTIFLCIGLGWAVDKFFGTKLLVWFIVLGVIAGFKSVYILIRRYLGNDEQK